MKMEIPLHAGRIAEQGSNMQISAAQAGAWAAASGESCAKFAPSCVPGTGRSLYSKNQKQMGPTLLPTPLLPSRGLLVRRTFQEALGTRFLSPPTGWRFFSPTLASASGLAFQLSPTCPCRSLFKQCYVFQRYRDHSPFAIASLKRLVSASASTFLGPQPGSWPIQ